MSSTKQAFFKVSLIGTPTAAEVGLTCLKDVYKRQEQADNEVCIGVGYIYNKSYWGKGFAIEAASACLDLSLIHI